jgi:N-acetylmuramoyl-L-alanine amidase
MKTPMIVIDAGHGGHDPGSVGWATNTPDIIPRQEDDHNLIIAKVVAAELDACGYYVAMTRTGDRYMSLAERVDFANKLNPDVLISIHRDASKSPESRGMHTEYHAFGVGRPSKHGMRLAKCLQKHVSKRTGLTDNGVRSRPAWDKDGNQTETSLMILRETNPPAALLELGFMSNPDEELLGDNSEFAQAVAIGIIEGLNEYFGRKGC